MTAHEPEPGPDLLEKPRREPVSLFGRQLRAARLAAGYRSGAAAARAIGMTQANWWRQEMTDRLLAWRTVRRILVGLRLPLECFLPRDLILEAAERIRAGQAVPVPGCESGAEAETAATP